MLARCIAESQVVTQRSKFEKVILQIFFKAFCNFMSLWGVSAAKTKRKTTFSQNQEAKNSDVAMTRCPEISRSLCRAAAN